MIETEKNYVDVLQTLIQCFMKPLSKVMKQNDFRTIFKGIEVKNKWKKYFYYILSIIVIIYLGIVWSA